MDETAVMDFLMDKSMLLDILLAIVLGFAIGLEREMTNKWAGFKNAYSCLFGLLRVHFAFNPMHFPFMPTARRQIRRESRPRF